MLVSYFYLLVCQLFSFNGSYLNLTIAAVALAVLLVAFTRGRLGYRQEDSDLALPEEYPATSQG